MRKRPLNTSTPGSADPTAGRQNLLKVLDRRRLLWYNPGRITRSAPAAAEERMNAMYQINNFTNNDDVKLLDSLGPFTVIEYQKDLSVMPGSASWPITATP